MNVFVETNFVLELIFQRDHYVVCQQLVEMAEKREITLSLPAYSVVEPYESIIRRRKSRRQTYDALSRELADITRSMPFEEKANELAQLTGLLIQVGEVEQNEARKVISQLLKVATLIDLDNAILQDALSAQESISLGPQDAVVFASIMSRADAHGAPSCFITRNNKDFSDPVVVDQFEQCNCKLFFDFERGCSYIRHKLTPNPA